MAENGYSLADIGALMNNRNGNGWGWGDGGFIWLIALFFLFGFGGNGWGFGGRNGLQGQDNMIVDQFGQSRILDKLNAIGNGICDSTYALNTTLLQGQAALGREVMENRFAAKECCCETNRNIDAVRYDAAKNTCDIITNATANTQRILDFLCEDKIQTLRDKLADRDRDLQTAYGQLSQQNQTATIINSLRPTPIPAYLTCSPYQSSAVAYQGFGGFGCGCGF